jgi:Trk K+ transport system NAD-binding subunit
MTFVNQLRTHVRFSLYLLWEFRWPLGVFWAVVLLGGAGLRALYHTSGKVLSYPESCYAVFQMFFLQAQLDFPEEWYLQPFFFLVPIVGLGALADSLVRLGYLVFARKSKLPEWQRMIAASYRQHIVVVGVGKVGYHIIKGLLALREQVVAIDVKTESLTLDEIRDVGVPIITGNARHQKVLQQAGVGLARVIVVVTDDDLANLDSALTARQINPAIQVVLRLFDHTLATKFAARFHMPAISVSEVSAGAFIAAATGHRVYQAFALGDQHLHVTDLTISPAGALAGLTVGQVQTDHSVNVVMHHGAAGAQMNPSAQTPLAPQDTLLVIAELDRLLALEKANRSSPSRHPVREESS